MDQISFVREKILLGNDKDILAKEEVFSRQKSRETWIDVGDKNLMFFNNVIKKHKDLNHISKLKKANRVIIEDPKEITQEEVTFY
ncbi:hypothetical protein SUGI_0737770 [Cryptomeria japonica]|nr:hypothetical protein SUGI_0737770 [Cryptomeria japonica]